MDRSVLEGDPHAVIEGMLIGSYAIGAHEGYIYVRSEYPLAVSTITHAIQQAEERGLLGDDIFGSGRSLRDQGPPRGGRLRLRRGDGADRLDRRPCGRAAHPAALPGRQGPVGQADGDQQRQDLGQRGPDPQPRRGLVRRARHRAEPRHHGLLPGRRREEHRPGRESPWASRSARWSSRSAAACGASGRSRPCRPAGPRGGCIPASMLDLPIDYEKLGRGRLDDGLRRHDRAGRRAPAWSTWPASSSAFTADESCGKCVALPRGDASRCCASSRGSARAAACPSDLAAAGAVGPARSSRPRSAGWAAPRRTRCSRPCDISATSSRPTSATRNARPACAAT